MIGRRKGKMAQARAHGEDGQAGGRGQEQGTGRLGGTGRADKLAEGGRWRRHPTGEVKRSAAPRCELPDATPQNKDLNLFVFILSSHSCQLIFFYKNTT